MPSKITSENILEQNGVDEILALFKENPRVWKHYHEIKHSLVIEPKLKKQKYETLYPNAQPIFKSDTQLCRRLNQLVRFGILDKNKNQNNQLYGAKSKYRISKKYSKYAAKAHHIRVIKESQANLIASYGSSTLYGFDSKKYDEKEKQEIENIMKQVEDALVSLDSIQLRVIRRQWIQIIRQLVKKEKNLKVKQILNYGPFIGNVCFSILNLYEFTKEECIKRELKLFKRILKLPSMKSPPTLSDEEYNRIGNIFYEASIKLRKKSEYKSMTLLTTTLTEYATKEYLDSLTTDQPDIRQPKYRAYWLD
jgi:hypothetical protein